MIKRTDKDAVIANVRKQIEKSEAIFLTNLIGIGSNDAVRIRRDIRLSDGKMLIARNTLLQKAAAGTKCESLMKNLKGPHAVAFAFSEAPRVAKVLYDASKEFELVQFKGGMLNDKALTPKQIEELAKLPSREQMLGTVLATFMAPISAFARVLHSVKEKKEQEVQ